MIDFSELNKRFVSAEETWGAERLDRIENASRILSFGVPYLDHALDGIEPSDLIVVGAASGRGKTQICTIMAMANAKKGKRVAFFALEAEEHEILRRMKYQAYAQAFFADEQRAPIAGIRYSQWRLAKYEDAFKKYDKAVSETLSQVMPTLKAFYRGHQFGVDDFKARVAEIGKETDLVILDHLNYFDFPGDNENRAVSEAVKEIRGLQKSLKIPIVMAAHVRKRAFGDKSIVPSIEEFHGSSDIFKNSTKCVMIAPNFDYSKKSPTEMQTYIHAGKHRHDGSINRYIARCTFDISSGSYRPEYEVGVLGGGGARFEEIEFASNVPVWAIGHKLSTKIKAPGGSPWLNQD